MKLSKLMVVALFYAFLVGGPLAYGQLTPTFYDDTCPSVVSIIRGVIAETLIFDRRIGASLIRLHFHDCFVNGCDGSILLDKTATIDTEKEAFANNNSARGFDVVDIMKERLEGVCPDTVSCADILAIAAEESVVLAGGPWWPVPLGRRDSLTANRTAANAFIPGPRDTLERLSVRLVAINVQQPLTIAAAAIGVAPTMCTHPRCQRLAATIVEEELELEATFVEEELELAATIIDQRTSGAAMDAYK